MANQGEQVRQDIPSELMDYLKILTAREARVAKQEDEKEAKALAMKLKREKDLVDVARREEAEKVARRTSCPHFREQPGKGPKHLWRGQVHNDGIVIPVCMNCQTTWPGFKANQEMLINGVNMEQWTNCNTDVLSSYHKSSFPGGCKRETCFVCYPKK